MKTMEKQLYSANWCVAGRLGMGAGSGGGSSSLRLLTRKGTLHPHTHVSCLINLPPSLCRQGDVYVGSNWNVMTIGLAIAFLVPILGLFFAWSTYGTLWATSEFYGAL